MNVVNVVSVISLVFIALSVLMFVMKVPVSYTSHGGSIGMVPVLDGAIFPPLFGTFGLGFWCSATRTQIPGGWIALVGLWLVSTLLCTAAIVYAGRLGEKRGV